MAQTTQQSTYRKDGAPSGNTGQPKENRCLAYYDFAVDGGAISQITLRGDTVPSGAIVKAVDVIVETPPTSGGAATISLDLEGAGDLQAAAAYNGAPYSTAGDTAAFKKIVTTADRAVKATIAAATLTAGKLQVIVTYWMRG